MGGYGDGEKMSRAGKRERMGFMYGGFHGRIRANVLEKIGFLWYVAGEYDTVWFCLW